MNIKNWENNIRIFSTESKSVKMYCNVYNKYRKFKTTIYESNTTLWKKKSKNPMTSKSLNYI